MCSKLCTLKSSLAQVISVHKVRDNLSTRLASPGAYACKKERNVSIVNIYSVHRVLHYSYTYDVSFEIFLIEQTCSACGSVAGYPFTNNMCHSLCTLQPSTLQIRR